MILGSVSFNILSDDVTLVVKGIGDSKATAIIDAQRNALRASYGEFVSNNLTTLDNELTKNETVNLVSGTIQESKLLSESKDDFSIPPIIEVLMEITVNKGKLVSFAKAIGDNVEIQGSLFGAELKQQQINIKNEAIAMEHLVKKAEIMVALFDYEIEVNSPKRSVTNETDYYIYSSMSLKTNQNYINLIETVFDTMNSIAMKPDEIKKFNEINTPYHTLYIADILDLPPRDSLDRCIEKYAEGDYRQQSDFEAKNPRIIVGIKNITNSKLYKFNLRTNESLRSFEKIRDSIYRSMARYEPYRQTRTDKRIMFPFRLALKDTDMECYMTTFNNVSYFQDRSIFNKYISSSALKERVQEMQPEKDKKKSSIYYDKFGAVNRIEYEDQNFSNYALDVDRIHAYRGWGQDYINVYHREEAWIGDDKIFSPSSNEERINRCIDRITITQKIPNYIIYELPGYETPTENCVARSNTSKYRDGGYEPNSLALPTFIYSTPNSINSQDQKFGIFFTYPKGLEFANLKYEDVVDQNTLSSITGYIVDPDKKTKR